MRLELRPAEPTPLSDSLPRLETFVSDLTGVVRSVTETLSATDEMRLVSVGCELAEAAGTVGNGLEGYTGSCHWDGRAARAAAIGEAVERYSASYIPEHEFFLGPASELPTAVDPDRFSLFNAEQYASDGFPFRPFGRDTVVAWVEGFSLPGGEPAHLPAQLVYLPWRRRGRNEVLIGHGTSNGLACAPSREEAVLTGLLELMERDAVMLSWYNRLSLPRLEWTGESEFEALDRRYFAPSGLRYSVVDLSAFHDVPTALAVVHGAPGQLGALGIGAGAATTIEIAWRKALSEAFSVQRWVRDRAIDEPGRLDQQSEEIQSFDDHTLFYAREDRALAAAFLDASPEVRSLGDVPELEGGDVVELIEAIMRRLRRRGVSAYVVDVTSPDVRQGGFDVVHVVSPELYPIDVLERARFLGCRRLYRAAYEAGLAPAPLEASDLNPLPHPFP